MSSAVARSGNGKAEVGEKLVVVDGRIIMPVNAGFVLIRKILSRLSYCSDFFERSHRQNRQYWITLGSDEKG